MNVSAVLLARTIALFDVADLSPRGALYGPRLANIIKERFNFAKVGTEEAEQRGLSFDTGQYDGQTILNLTIYDDGIKLDLQSNTENGKRFIIDNLATLSEEGIITFRPEMIIRWGFVSNVTFYSEYDLDRLIHPALIKLGNKVDGFIKERTGLELHYRGLGVDLSFDRTFINPPLSNFSIQRRGSIPYGKQKYFSAAPLETKDHIDLLVDLERDVIESRS